MPKKIAPMITDWSAAFYEETFKNLNAGSMFVLDAFPTLYKRALFDLKGIFTRGELCLMIDLFNGLILTPQIAGQHIAIEVKDGIELESLDKKWEVNKDEILVKLEGLDIFPFKKACLEIWLRAFWDGKREGQEGSHKTDLESYVAQLRSEEKTPLKAFYVTGYNGSYLELSDGRFIDSVEGETSEHFRDDSRQISEILSTLLDELYKSSSITWTDEDEWKKWRRAITWEVNMDKYVCASLESGEEEENQ